MAKRKAGKVAPKAAEKVDRFETLKAEHRAVFDRRCPYLTEAERNLAAHEAASRDIYGVKGENHLDPWAPLPPFHPNVKREEPGTNPENIKLLIETVNTALAAAPWNRLDMALGRWVYIPPPLLRSPILWDTAVIVRDLFRNAGWFVDIRLDQEGLANDEDRTVYFCFEWPTDLLDPTADIAFEEY